MPYKDRDYQKEYAREPKRRRAARRARNRARYKLEQDGRVQKGDGKHVHHKDGNPENNGDGNLGVRDGSSHVAKHKTKGESMNEALPAGWRYGNKPFDIDKLGWPEWMVFYQGTYIGQIAKVTGPTTTARPARGRWRAWLSPSERPAWAGGKPLSELPGTYPSEKAAREALLDAWDAAGFGESVTEGSRAGLIRVTSGMANTMTRGRKIARVCKACDRGVPAYPGRYPANCPMCGGPLESACAESVVTYVPGQEPDPDTPVIATAGFVEPIQGLLEVGQAKGGGIAVPYAEVERHVPAGVRGLDWYTEGTEDGRRYRVEGPFAPVLIVEFDDAAREALFTVTDEPARALGFDPRAEMVADGGWDGQGWVNESVNENILRDLTQEVLWRLGLFGVRPKKLAPQPVWQDSKRVLQAVANAVRAGEEPVDHKVVAKHAGMDPEAARKIIKHLSGPGRYAGEPRPLTVVSGAGLRLTDLGRKWIKLGESRVLSEREWPEATRKALERSVIARTNRDNKTKVGGEWRIMVPSHTLNRATAAVGFPSMAPERGTFWYGSMSDLPTEVLVALRAIYKGKLAKKHFAVIKAVMGIDESLLEAKGKRFMGRVTDDIRRRSVFIDDRMSKRDYRKLMKELSYFKPDSLPYMDSDKGLTLIFKTQQSAENFQRQAYRLFGHSAHVRWEGEYLDEPEYDFEGDWDDLPESRLDERGFITPASLAPMDPAPPPPADEDKRASAFRSPRKNDRQRGTAIHGATRFTVGGRKRKVSKDVQADLQRKINARRGQAKRIEAARRWHQSYEGRKLHKDLGNYNRGKHKGESENTEWPDTPYLENAVLRNESVLAERLEKGTVYEVVRPGATLSGGYHVPGIGPDGRPGWEGKVKLDVGALIEYVGKVSAGPWNPMVDQFVLLDGALGSFPERGYGVLRGSFHPSKMGRADERYLYPWEDQFDESLSEAVMMRPGVLYAHPRYPWWFVPAEPTKRGGWKGHWVDWEGYRGRKPSKVKKRTLTPDDASMPWRPVALDVGEDDDILAAVKARFVEARVLSEGLDERDPYAQDTMRWVARGGMGGGNALVTQADLNALERILDSLFAKVGIDIEFTRHFLDRVNDRRNKRQITIDELSSIFHEVFQRHANKIKGRGADWEAVIADLTSNINIPFVLNYDRRNRSLELVAKTVMRKRGFKTRNKRLTVTTAAERVEAARARVGALLGENTAGAMHPSAIPPLPSGMATQEPSTDDIFDSVLRRLIVIESSDVLEDVNFDENGSIYLFFDPSLTRKEIDEVHKWVQNEHQNLALVASPDQTLPEESVRSDWWVMFLPGKAVEEGAEVGPDPAKYARPEDANGEGPRRQMLVPSQPTPVEQIAVSVDTKKLMKGIGEAHRWLAPYAEMTP